MHQRVVRCNGQRVRNLRHLTLMVAEAIADATIAPAVPAAAAAATTVDVTATATAAVGSSSQSPELGSGSGSGSSSGPPLDPSYITLELSSRLVMVLPLEVVVADTREMLGEYEVAHAVSEDLRTEYEGVMKARRQQLAAAGEKGAGAGEKAGKGKGKGRGGRSGKGR